MLTNDFIDHLRLEAHALWGDLPGVFMFEVSGNHADFFLRNQVAIVVRHDVSPADRPRSIVWGALQQLDKSLLDEDPGWWAAFIVNALDARVRPWLKPDDYRWPEVVLWPRLRRLEQRSRSGWWKLRVRWFNFRAR